jgi:hypothetical protein
MKRRKKGTKRITIELRRRDADDPYELLQAIVDALGITGAGYSSSSNPSRPPKEITSGDAHDALLAEKCTEMTLQMLDKVAAEAKRDAMFATVESERKEVEILAMRQGLRAFVEFQLGQGVRITVEIYQKTVGAAATVVSKIVGGVFGGSEDKKKSE